MPTPFSIGSSITLSASISAVILCAGSVQAKPPDRPSNHEGCGYDACPADKLGQRDSVAHIPTATTATKTFNYVDRKIDDGISSVPQNQQPAWQRTRAASSRNPERHHPGIGGRLCPDLLITSVQPLMLKHSLLPP